jgi:hypothetical protein
MNKNLIQNEEGKLLLYTNLNGTVELRADTDKETIWATQMQIAELFEIERTVVTKHINNILKDNEVDKKSNVQKMHIANSDKPVSLYSLDIILAVGYRTNSSQAIKFRIWATTTLREYLIKGIVVNNDRVNKLPDKILNDLHQSENRFTNKQKAPSTACAAHMQTRLKFVDKFIFREFSLIPSTSLLIHHTQKYCRLSQ